MSSPPGTQSETWDGVQTSISHPPTVKENQSPERLLNSAQTSLLEFQILGLGKGRGICNFKKNAT